MKYHLPHPKETTKYNTYPMRAACDIYWKHDFPIIWNKELFEAHLEKHSDGACIKCLALLKKGKL